MTVFIDRMDWLEYAADLARRHAERLASGSDLSHVVVAGCCPNCGSDRLIVGDHAVRCSECTARLQLAVAA